MIGKISLEGCFPPIPTPFDQYDRVDHDRLTANLEKWQTPPLRGLLFSGPTVNRSC